MATWARECQGAVREMAPQPPPFKILSEFSVKSQTSLYRGRGGHQKPPSFFTSYPCEGDAADKTDFIKFI